ncbi:hypothetical protein ACLOJK_007762, partial [Asimina triloba]
SAREKPRPWNISQKRKTKKEKGRQSDVKREENEKKASPAPPPNGSLPRRRRHRHFRSIVRESTTASSPVLEAVVPEENRLRP